MGTVIDLVTSTARRTGGLTAAIGDPRQAVPDSGVATWEGVLVVEGATTGDGRMIEQGALEWPGLPLPLRWTPADAGEHDGAVVVGLIHTMTRGDDGRVTGTGVIDLSSEDGRQAYVEAESGQKAGVSVDLDRIAYEVRIRQGSGAEVDAAPIVPEADQPEGEATDADGRVVADQGQPDDVLFVTTGATIRAATLVDIPAFEDAAITITGTREATEDEPEPVTAAGVLRPPRGWFNNPALKEPTPVTVTADGRVYGHLAAWGTPHTGATGETIIPPHSASGYRYFRMGQVETDDGTMVSTGPLTVGTGHANLRSSPQAALAHYDNTGAAVADVAVGEDAHGIWVAGTVRPGASDEQVAALRASALSGDWRPIRGSLELMGALAVNLPGFPIPAPAGMVADGHEMALVAAGVVQRPRPVDLTDRQVQALRAMADERLQAEQQEARATVHRAAAARMVARVGKVR